MLWILNKTISCINVVFTKHKHDEQTTRIHNTSEKHMSKKTKGGSETLKTNLGPSCHTSEQSNRK